MAQYHQKFPLPEYFKTVQHQPAMNPFTNVYQTIPNVVSSLFSFFIFKNRVIFCSKS